MFLAEPSPTPWDIHFRMLGIDVRVSAWFWLGSVLFGWSFAQSVSRNSAGTLSIGAGLLIWTVAAFVSILVHELGHALTFRYFGVPAHIVLYHLGGLAIPGRGYGRYADTDPRRQILISLAGPAAQIVLAILVIGVILFAGYRVENPLPFIRQLKFLESGKPLESVSLSLSAFVDAFVYVSVFWAILNLLPVYPLDGGQISREVFTLSNAREGIRYSLILSICVGVGMAVWFWKQGSNYGAIMFGLLAYSSFMTLQAYFGGGRGFGGDRW